MYKLFHIKSPVFNWIEIRSRCKQSDRTIRTKSKLKKVTRSCMKSQRRWDGKIIWKNITNKLFYLFFPLGKCWISNFSSKIVKKVSQKVSIPWISCFIDLSISLNIYWIAWLFAELKWTGQEFIWHREFHMDFYRFANTFTRECID